MSFNPDTPRSRDEVLLQAIVSGDSSMMGDPRDREEEFVKAIADKETLPDYSEASEGDVLRIGTDGPEWGAASSDLYLHNLTLSITNFTVDGLINIISSSSEAYTVSSLSKYLYDHGFVNVASKKPICVWAIPFSDSEGFYRELIGIWSTNGTNFIYQYRTYTILNYTSSGGTVFKVPTFASSSGGTDTGTISKDVVEQII